MPQQIGATQLHHLKGSGDAIQIEAGVSPNRQFGVMWPLAKTLVNANKTPVGDHYMFAKNAWWVGFKPELIELLSQK